eukprot:PITA_11609
MIKPELTNYSKLRKIAGLSGLRKLQVLDISRCKNVEELPGIETLVSLKELQAYDCAKLKSIRGLAELTKLRLQTLNNLESPNDNCMPRLQVLKVYSTKLSEVSFATGVYPILKYVSLGFCNHLVEVGTLPKTLIKLELTNCSDLRKIAGLSGLPKLQVLDISRCKNVEELPDSPNDNCMPQLQVLEVYNTKLSEVSFATGVYPILKYVSLRFCNHLVEVGTLPKTLIKLELTNCSSLKKIAGLSSLPKLQVLDISRCKNVEELPGIETLVSLKELQAYDCAKLKSIRGLAELTKLRVLNVHGCSKLEGLPGIQHCKSLEYTDAKCCPRQWAEAGLLEQLQQQVKVLEI